MNGDVPGTFEGQCEVIWDNISSILESASMNLSNLIKVTTFLTHADQVKINSEIRRKILGVHTPALTIIIAQTLESKWMLEIEAIAAA